MATNDSWKEKNRRERIDKALLIFAALLLALAAAGSMCGCVTIPGPGEYEKPGMSVYLDPHIQGPAVAFMMGEPTDLGWLQVESENWWMRNIVRIIGLLVGGSVLDILEDGDLDAFGILDTGSGHRASPPPFALATTVPGQNTVSARDGGKVSIQLDVFQDAQHALNLDHVEAVGPGSEVSIVGGGE